MSDLRQTHEYAKYMKGIGWYVEKIDNAFAYIKKVPLLGHFIKIQRPDKININKVSNLTKKYKTFQIVIEPKDQNQVFAIKKSGFKLSKSFFVPSRTIQIDLTKSVNTLLREMHYKTRYNIKKFSNTNFQFSLNKEIGLFAEFWQKCAAKRGMYLAQKNEITELFKAFGSDAHIISVSKNSEILSSLLLIKTGRIAYYMYAAGTEKGKKFYAPTINAWEAILLAKKLKCNTFDFEGVFDERFPLPSWKGFTRFKKSFGGKEIVFPGAYRKFYLPFLS